MTYPIHSLATFTPFPNLTTGMLLAACVVITLLCAAAAHLLVKRFVLASVPAAIAMMAMWCVLLTAPGSAHADEETPTPRRSHHKLEAEPDEANKKFEAFHRLHSKPPKPGPKAKKGSK